MAISKRCRILAAAEHLRAQTDKSYLLARYAEMVGERVDTSGKLLMGWASTTSYL